jgi:hypothetical protein
MGHIKYYWNGEIVVQSVEDLYTPEYIAFCGDSFNPEAEAKKDFGDDFIAWIR